MFQELGRAGHHHRPRHPRAGHRPLRRRGSSRCATAASSPTSRQTPDRARIRSGARRRRRRRAHEPPAPCVRLAGRALGAQQDALLPHHARRGDRRGGGDRHGRHRRGREGGSSRPSRRWARTCSSCCPARRRPGGMQGGFGTQPTLTWDDLRRSRPSCSAVRCAAPGAARERGGAGEDQNWTTGVVGTTPEYFADPQLGGRRGPCASTPRTSTAGPRSSCSGRRSSRSSSGRREPGGPGRCGSRWCPSRSSACWRRRASRRWARTTTTPRSSRSTTFQAKIRAGSSKYLTGAIFVSAVSADAHRERQQQITGLLRDRHQLGAGHRRRLLGPEPLRDRQRPGSRARRS